MWKRPRKRSFYGLNQYWTNHIIPCNCFTCGLSLRFQDMNALPGFSLPGSFTTEIHYRKDITVLFWWEFNLIITDSYKRKIVLFSSPFHPVSCVHKTSWFSLFPGGFPLPSGLGLFGFIIFYQKTLPSLGK